MTKIAYLFEKLQLFFESKKPSEKYMLFVLPSLLLGFAGYYLSLALIQESKKVVLQKQNLQQTLVLFSDIKPGQSGDMLGQKKLQAMKLSMELEELKAKSSYIKSSLSGGASPIFATPESRVDFINLVALSANKNSVKVGRLESLDGNDSEINGSKTAKDANIAAAQALRSVKMRLVASGELKALLLFLSEIESLPLLVKVDSIDMNSKNVVNITVVMTIFEVTES